MIKFTDEERIFVNNYIEMGASVSGLVKANVIESDNGGEEISFHQFEKDGETNVDWEQFHCTYCDSWIDVRMKKILEDAVKDHIAECLKPLEVL